MFPSSKSKTAAEKRVTLSPMPVGVERNRSKPSRKLSMFKIVSKKQTLKLTTTMTKVLMTQIEILKNETSLKYTLIS